MQTPGWLFGRGFLCKWKVNEINIGNPDELPERQKALKQVSVSECEFSKAVDKVYLIRTGTALGDIHVAGRLSRTSCSLHPDYSPLLKKISTLSDRHLPEGLLPLREFCLSIPLKNSKQNEIVFKKPVAHVGGKDSRL